MPAAGARADDLFLPDLCGIRAIFMVVVIGELLAIVMTLARVGADTDMFGELGLVSLYTQWIALSCAAGLCLARRPLSRLREPLAAFLGYALLLAIAYVICEAAWWLVDPFVADGGLITIGRHELIIRTLGISAIVSAATLRYFHVQHHSTQRSVSLAHARLEALQARIRPHFLFNCMNTIASLTRSDPARAERAVEDLADLFRANLVDARDLVRLTEEVDLAKRYLSIEALRLGARLTVRWDIDGLLGDARVPLLTLQPLLENAIYHGIEPLAEGGVIEIRGATRDRALWITITNPLNERTFEHYAGNRLAQENVRQRLAAHFGTAGQLTIDANGDRYCVTLRVPIRSHDDADRDR